MDYITILNNFIKDNYKNLNQFCKEYKLNYSMYHQVLNGKKAFDILAAKNLDAKIFEKTGQSIFTNESPTSAKLAAVKLYHVKACAGSGKECYLEDSHEPIGLPWKILNRYGLKPENVMAVEVDGLSMMPTYNPEDYIFVATTDDMKLIKNFEPYLIRYDHELMIKRLEQAGNTLIMHSDNPDKNRYPARTRINEIDFEVIGRIFKKLGD